VRGNEVLPLTLRRMAAEDFDMAVTMESVDATDGFVWGSIKACCEAQAIRSP